MARMSSGSAFHADGPACEKARSPNLVRKRATRSRLKVQTGDQDDVGWQQQIGRCSSDTPESCHDGSSSAGSDTYADCVYLSICAGYQHLDNGSLRIDSVSMKHSGIYVCVAQNSAGTAMAQVRLQVQGYCSHVDQNAQAQ